ncbi:hypothetical protein VL03_06860 [Rossellomorea marisflavi]|nr:hypothetical protein VL03_06860 [Rossellomorea marisflavi]
MIGPLHPLEFLMIDRSPFVTCWLLLNFILIHDGRRRDVPFHCGRLLSTGRKSSLLILTGSRSFLYSRWSQAASASLHFLVERRIVLFHELFFMIHDRAIASIGVFDD